jgi:hypothetical protein
MDASKSSPIISEFFVTPNSSETSLTKVSLILFSPILIFPPGISQKGVFLFVDLSSAGPDLRIRISLFLLLISALIPTKNLASVSILSSMFY